MPKVIWFTGLSGAGKTTIAEKLKARINGWCWCRISKIYTDESTNARGYKKTAVAMILDGDKLRDGLNADLGFQMRDRDENLRRSVHVARLFYDHGFTVLATFITPLEAQRKYIRSCFPVDDYAEVFVDAPLVVCQKRDPKGLYAKVAAGEIKNFTGIDSIFESPKNADIILKTEEMTASECVVRVFNKVFK